MTSWVDAAAEALDNKTITDSCATRDGNIITISEVAFAQGSPRAGESVDEREAFYRRVAASGKLDAGRTVRSGLAYDLDSTDPIPPSDAERAARIRAAIGDEPLVGLEHRPIYRFVKRAFDIAFSAAVIVVFSWLFLLVAIAVKIDDPRGPVFFKQTRVTKGGREYQMLKFRSMCVDAEERLAELQELNEKTGPVFKIADDPRITRVGKVIRKLSLDELPQFFNVFKGDMSVIGPRPALPTEVKTYTDYQRQRLLIRNGLSCYWQTRRNRDAITFEEWVDLDLCRKGDPESKGLVENAVGFVKSSYFSARSFSCIDDVIRSLPAWVERKNRRIHQGTYQVPQRMFEDVERAALRPLLPSLYEAAPAGLVEAPVNSQPYVLHRAVKYSVPWEMCYTTAYKRVIGGKLHIYDDKRRYVCTHDVCEVRGAFIRLEEYRRQPASDWIDAAERMRRKWNCTEFQHFVNGFKKENEGRHLGEQLAAVERYLDEKRPTREFAAAVIAACCRDWRYRYTQFKAVYDLMEAQSGSIASPVVEVAAADVDTRGLESYRAAFEERCA